jgi:hypothetical protein
MRTFKSSTGDANAGVALGADVERLMGRRTADSPTAARMAFI